MSLRLATRVTRSSCGTAVVSQRISGVECLGQRPDLVHLDQQRICQCPFDVPSRSSIDDKDASSPTICTRSPIEAVRRGPAVLNRVFRRVRRHQRVPSRPRRTRSSGLVQAMGSLEDAVVLSVKIPVAAASRASATSKLRVKPADSMARRIRSNACGAGHKGRLWSPRPVTAPFSGPT